MPTSRAEAVAADERSPLRGRRDLFDLPDGVVYLDGNSLGALPAGVADTVREVVEQQWGRDLITSWNVHDWWDAPRRVGARIARLVGAEDDEVLVADSTSANLVKVLVAAGAKVRKGGALP